MNVMMKVNYTGCSMKQAALARAKKVDFILAMGGGPVTDCCKIVAAQAVTDIQALADFVKEMGLPSTFTEMGFTDKNVLEEVADTCNLTAGCCRKLSRKEVFEILEKCR